MIPSDKTKQHNQEDLILKKILQDDNAQTTKKQIQEERMFAFSAPPALYDFGYKLDDEELDQWDFDQPEPNIPEKIQNSKKQSSHNHLYSPQIKPHKGSFNPEVSSFPNLTLYSTNQQISSKGENQAYDFMNNLGQICDWSKDQQGSRTVQNILENGNDYQKQQIFSILISEFQQLIKDRFGNYVFQKIFEKGLEKHRKVLIGTMKGHYVEFSEHSYGCRVVQKAIQCMSTDYDAQVNFMKEIEPYNLRLIQNQNGNHVIQKCFQIFSGEPMEALINIILTNLSLLAFHPYGCRVIQKYLENSQATERTQITIKKLLSIAKKLSQCQYGNYVMQHIVTNCPQHKQQVFEIFYDNFEELSCNKYASNVIQKAIKFSPPQFKIKLAQSLINETDKNLIYLAKHQYANYVIQSLYEKLPRDLKQNFKAKLKYNAQQISKSQYGRHVLTQLDRQR